MSEERRPLWDCIEEARDRDYDEPADRSLFAMALLELRRKNTELRNEMSSALEEIRDQLKRLRSDRDEITANVDEALDGIRGDLALKADQSYAKRIDSAVDDLARKIGDLDSDVRRLSR